ncbi:unnamed protein product [Rhizophagus irregularis]|nr:unnamed protein product [Rhizophagus irregularis]
MKSNFRRDDYSIIWLECVLESFLMNYVLSLEIKSLIAETPTIYTKFYTKNAILIILFSIWLKKIFTRLHAEFVRMQRNCFYLIFLKINK